MLSAATYVFGAGNGRPRSAKFVVCGNDFATQVDGMIVEIGGARRFPRLVV
jgi:hypothetical protein